MSAPRKELPNLNTLLLTVIMALSTWTLRTVYEINTKLTTVAAQVDEHARQIVKMERRADAAEAAVTDLRIRARAGRMTAP